MKIFFVNGMRAGDEMDFAETDVTIGREEDNVLRIPTGGVSRYHAKLYFKDGSWFAADLGSTNGVKLNRKRIEKDVLLNEGDLLEFGDQMIRVTALKPSATKVVFHAIGTPESDTDAVPAKPEEVPAPSPAPAEPVQPSPKAEGAFPSLSNFKMPDVETLFDKAKNAAKSRENAPQQGKRKISNLTFYTIIGCFSLVAIVYIFKFMGGMEQKKNTAADLRKTADAPLFFKYVRENFHDQKIFRFSLEIAKDKAIFTIDDLKAGRNISKEIAINPRDLELLKSNIRESGITRMQLPERSRSEVFDRRRVILAQKPDLLDFTIDGEVVPLELESVERAISVFSENYGFQLVSLSAEELLKQAESAVIKAEELYENREASGTNLRDAIAQFKLAIQYLEQFSPAPPLLKRARKGCLQAEDSRKKRLQELNFEYTRAMDRNDFAKVREHLIKIMELCEVNGKSYDIARLRLFKIDTYLRKKR